MKVQLKLDKQAIQDFFKLHVEKLLFVAVVLVFLFFVYQAVGRDTFNEDPASLESAAKRALEHMKNKAAPAGVEATLYPKKVEEEIIAKLDSKGYGWEERLNPPIFSEARNRKHPELLEVRELRVSAGRAPFNMIDPEEAEQLEDAGRLGGPEASNVGRAERRGQRYAVITGLVPIADQENAFHAAFSGVSGPKISGEGKAVLQYLGYRVYRLEVPPSGKYSEDDWRLAERFNSKTERERVDKAWGTGGRQNQDKCEARFVDDPNLTFPLGPRVEGTWDEEVVHAPEIPILDRRQRIAQGRRYDASGKPEVDWTGTNDEKSKDAKDAKEATGEGLAPGQPGYEDQFEEPDVKLFRYFDFHVEPGKRYVYRIHLVMLNPNYGLPERQLTDEAKAFVNSEWLETPRGATTDVVQIPRDDEVLLVDVKTGAPNAKLRGVKWINERGIEVSEGFTADRGELANHLGEPLPEQMGGPMGFGPQQPPPGIGPAGGIGLPKPPEPEKVHYQSNALVLDLRGGDLLRIGQRKRTLLHEPGAVLLLDADNHLVVHEKFKDLVEAEVWRARQEPEPIPGTMPGGEMMPGEYPEGYGPEGVYGPPGLKREKRSSRRDDRRKSTNPRYQKAPKYPGNKLPID